MHISQPLISEPISDARSYRERLGMVPCHWQAWTLCPVPSGEHPTLEQCERELQSFLTSFVL